jgi:hypothetical protein
MCCSLLSEISLQVGWHVWFGCRLADVTAVLRLQVAEEVFKIAGRDPLIEVAIALQVCWLINIQAVYQAGVRLLLDFAQSCYQPSFAATPTCGMLLLLLL